MIWVDFIRDEESKLMNENDEQINELCFKKQMTEIKRWLYLPKLSNSNNLRWLAKVLI